MRTTIRVDAASLRSFKHFRRVQCRSSKRWRREPILIVVSGDLSFTLARRELFVGVLAESSFRTLSADSPRTLSLLFPHSEADLLSAFSTEPLDHHLIPRLLL